MHSNAEEGVAFISVRKHLTHQTACLSMDGTFSILAFQPYRPDSKPVTNIAPLRMFSKKLKKCYMGAEQITVVHVWFSSVYL